LQQQPLLPQPQLGSQQQLGSSQQQDGSSQQQDGSPQPQPQPRFLNMPHSESSRPQRRLQQQPLLPQPQLGSQQQLGSSQQQDGSSQQQDGSSQQQDGSSQPQPQP
jgi:hypothetical protein